MQLEQRKISLEQLKVNYVDTKKGIVVDSNYEECCDAEEQKLKIDEVNITNQDVLVPSFTLKVNLEQTFQCLGQFTDSDYISKPSKHYEYHSMCAREVGVDISKYNNETYWVEGLTENKLSFVESYIKSDKYRENLNISDNPTKCFSGVISKNGTDITYVINGDVDSNGRYVQSTGVIYKTYGQLRQLLYDNGCNIEETEQRLTKFLVKRDKSDFQIQALLHECYQLGIANPKSVKNSVFVNRGIATPCSDYSQLSSIKSLKDLKRYNNGDYFKLWSEQ